MNTETTVSPGVETLNNASETVEPEVTEPGAEVEHEAEPEKDDADKALRRMQRRIDKRTADVYRERAANEQLKARLAELEAQTKESEEPRQQETRQADPVVIARHIAAVVKCTDWSNKLVADGTKSHADFKEALSELVGEVGELVRYNGLPSPFLAVVQEASEDPKALLYYLGKNPDVASELADLGPIRLAKRIVKIEEDIAAEAKQKTSKAPKPLDALKASGGGAKTLATASDEEFYKLRRQQIASRGR